MSERKESVPMARGYELFEVISALQKECRRGNSREALYWAYCLLPGYEAHLWRRLLVIAVEDVGMGDPDCIVRVRALKDTWDEMRSWNGDSYHLAIAQAVQTICAAKKSRTNDYLQCVVRAEFDAGQRREIPDYALDMHTRRGKAMGRGTAHFREHGAVLNPRLNERDEWEEEARKSWDAGFPLRENWAWKKKDAAPADNKCASKPDEGEAGGQGERSLFE